MHVRTTTVLQGKTTCRYLSLVESYREDGRMRHRTVARLGEALALAASGQPDRIIAALSAFARRAWVDAESIDGAGAPVFDSVAAVRACVRRLGLDEHFASVGKRRRAGHLEDAVFVTVANRLCEPGPKRRTITEWLDCPWP